jgi:hypothetical protein
LDPDEMAALVAAAQEIMLQRTSVPLMLDPVPNWRFSGRWFNAGHFSNRRPQLFN